MKKSKSVIEVVCAGVLVVLAAIAGGESLQKPYIDSVVEQPKMVQFLGTPVIEGPGQVEVGELARLSVEGERVDWDCVPKIVDGQEYGENNQNYVASFRTPGIYTVIAAVYANDTVEVLSFPIQVEGGEVVVVVPDEIDDRYDETLVENVLSWCNTSGPNKDRVMSVATVFGVVAIQIQDGELRNSAEIIARTATLNEKVNTNGLEPLLISIQTELISRSDLGLLETPAQHVRVWKSIAEGLERYASN